MRDFNSGGSLLGLLGAALLTRKTLSRRGDYLIFPTVLDGTNGKIGELKDYERRTSNVQRRIFNVVRLRQSFKMSYKLINITY